MPWKLIFFVIIIVFVAIFVGVNHANVCNISLIFVEFEKVPVYITILISFVVGMLIMLPFTIGKKRGKAYRQQTVREEYPAESSRNRRNRKRQEAAARKAARNNSKKAGDAAGSVILADETSGASRKNGAPDTAVEIPAITDGTTDNGKKGKSEADGSKGKGFFGLFSKKNPVSGGADGKNAASGATDAGTPADAAASSSEAENKPEEKK